MIYKKYGSTGIDMSVIGFGGMRFIETPSHDIETCASLVTAAYDAGINYFDTAPLYERSEEIFGAAFKQMKKTRSEKPFYVGTKTFGTTPDIVRRDLETSLKRMDLEYVDLYYVWCVLTVDAYEKLKKDGMIKEFEKLKSEGLIRHICISVHMAGEDIATTLADYPFAGMLAGYSAMNFAYRDEGIEAAAKLNMGVGTMNSLGGGIIPQHPQRFEFVKTQNDETVNEAALRFLINDKRITTSLVGLSNKEQLAEAVKAVDGFKPINDQGVSKIRDGVKEAFNELCTGCRYCDKCPEGIEVPKLMGAYNYYALSGEPMDMIKHLQNHWWLKLDEDDLSSRCTQCRECEKACTQKIDICRRLEEMESHISKYLENPG